MNITFTLNQTEAFALSESRYFEIYDLMRSYCGIQVGVMWDTDQLALSLHTMLVLTEDNEGQPCWYIRGTRFDSGLVWSAIEVHRLMLNVKLALAFVKEGGSVSLLSKEVKTLKRALQFVEW